MHKMKKLFSYCWATEKWTRDYDRRRSEREREREFFIYLFVVRDLNGETTENWEKM
jgi:viroplasmin and RNaseH domain-containing protein